jgi:hypothetical protein
MKKLKTSGDVAVQLPPGLKRVWGAPGLAEDARDLDLYKMTRRSLSRALRLEGRATLYVELERGETCSP